MRVCAREAALSVASSDSSVLESRCLAPRPQPGSDDILSPCCTFAQCAPERSRDSNSHARVRTPVTHSRWLAATPAAPMNYHIQTHFRLLSSERCLVSSGTQITTRSFTLLPLMGCRETCVCVCLRACACAYAGFIFFFTI